VLKLRESLLLLLLRDLTIAVSTAVQQVTQFVRVEAMPVFMFEVCLHYSELDVTGSLNCCLSGTSVVFIR